MQLSSPQMSLLMKWRKLIKKIHFWDLLAESALHCRVSGFTLLMDALIMIMAQSMPISKVAEMMENMIHKSGEL